MDLNIDPERFELLAGDVEGQWQALTETDFYKSFLSVDLSLPEE